MKTVKTLLEQLDAYTRQSLCEETHTPLPREEAVQRIKELKGKINAFAEKGGLTREEGQEFDSLHREWANHRFDHAKPPKMEHSIADSGYLSTLTPEITQAARTDALKHRGIFVGLHTAAAGVAHNQHTEVDHMVAGTHPTVSTQDLHAAFEPTRQALRKQFGPTMTLWRSPTKQMDKPTQNWATTKEAALQYGPKAVSATVPVDDVVAVNTMHRGKYHEVIIKTPKRNK